MFSDPNKLQWLAGDLSFRPIGDHTFLVLVSVGPQSSYPVCPHFTPLVAHIAIIAQALSKLALRKHGARI